MPHLAFIALGSNLGHREKNITAALTALQATREIEVVRVSSLYETEPVGGPPGQGAYLNAAAALQTSLDPDRLLSVCLRIEESLGRRRGPRHGPRPIDLDLLLYDDLVHAGAELTIPHPLMHERRFVMEPLAEIAPDQRHPILHQTAREILDALSTPGRLPPATED
jgi:2-amino-4-hydroxy-6-hydroxymethyldihydropteridine diphosphokinase